MKDKAQLLDRYQRLRHVGREVNHILVKRVGKDELEEGGRKLGVLHMGILTLGSEGDSTLLMDFCIHDLRRQGLTAVERFLAEAPPPPDSDERLFAEALAKAHFSLFLVEGREMDVGIHVRDLLGDDSCFIMDRSFSQSAPTDMVIVFRRIVADGIGMTTGAALPVCVLPKDNRREELLQQVRTILGGPLNRAESPEQRSEATATILNALLESGRSSNIQYVEPGTAPRTVSASGKPSVGRYDPCPCGSGKKFKFCCGARR